MLVIFSSLVLCILSPSLVSLIFFNFPGDDANGNWLFHFFFFFASLHASPYVFTNWSRSVVASYFPQMVSIYMAILGLFLLERKAFLWMNSVKLSVICQPKGTGGE